MGLMLTAVYQDVEDRSDAVHEFFINPDSPGEFDADGDGEISDGRERPAGPVLHELRRAHSAEGAHRRHRPLAMAGQRRFTMTVDGLFTRLDAPTVGYHQSYYVEDSILDEDTGAHRWSDVSIRDHWVTGMTVAELVPEISTITEHRVVDTTQFGWNGIGRRPIA